MTSHPTTSNSGPRHPHSSPAHWWRWTINWLKANKEAWDPLATICVGGAAAVLATLLTTYYTRKQTELQTAHEFSAVYLALGEDAKKVPAIRSLSVYADTFQENTLDLLVDMLNDKELAVKRAAVETLGRISRKNFTVVRARLHKELQKANHPAAAGLALAEIDSQSTSLAADDLKLDSQQVYLSFGRDSDPGSKGDCAESIAQFLVKDGFGDQTKAVVQSLD